MRATGNRKTKVTGMSVDVQLATEHPHTPEPEMLERWALSALSAGRQSGELCVRVVDNQESQTLNASYRGINKPTNVLSFPAEIDIPDARVLGDVVICAPIVEFEAVEQNKDVADHYAHMVVHGVLHLMGYDHESEGEAEQMEQLEITILGELGIADPYQIR